ncbi:MAG: IS110 family transposase [Verrucomicrobia bacterium]|nr:IS110 family transposase [Verrucomicrobiota bacterium]
MKTMTKYVGLDVHKDTTVIAVADGGRDGEVRLYGEISADLGALEKVLRKLGGEGITLHVVYEAGPTGFVIYRRLQQLGIDCIVVAPTKTPVEKGPRQKTDRRDAILLARLHRAGELTAIHVPDAVDESVRDLTRARADAVHDLTRARQRLKSFLLRQGYRYSGKANWSDAHQRYLRELVLPLPALKAVLEECLLAIDQATQRVTRLEELLAVQVPLWRMYPAVAALMTLRGFQLTAAAVLVAELGDVRRFSHPRHLMAFLGLIPREHSTGTTRRQGAITKAGNAHARWILVEAVQHAFLPPKVSAPLALRQKDQPTAFRELSWKIQVRLHQRGWHLLHRGVMKAKVTVALARELAGFVWDLLRQVPAPKS